ncbi:hypothetical protein MtrunA17_Chr5g0394561 [Medicago truncatula]|uniref:Uncharacterized protein n=1 Tax=Medicago truncatula TaxID=3880 RepID=G7K3N8_MEDTR|nr:uncharacterized protein LOC11441091 [Medicago truncatula]AES93691.1 hypothetical protein MTR_5g006410 [Medicago truncatula]RHN53318.1 hypothetical protein MtrunA17_Chr5g0394561 [Medicago truncatula]
MGEALFDLEQLLISKRAKLTPDEANILQSCKTNAIKNFTVFSLVSGAAAWTVTGRLGKAFQVNLTAGAAAFCGLRIFSRSLYSSADHILSLDGSTLQKELANILVTKYQHDPSLMKLISKHFYSERLYDDSASNTPKLRWRYRNFFSDNVINGNKTQDHDSYNKSQGNSHNDSYASDSLEKSQGKSENITDSKRTTRGTKQSFINPGSEVLSEVDPLDCLFGYGAPMEENFHPNTPNKPSGTHHRGHRRHRRRHRMRDHDDLSNSEHAAAV